MNLEIISVSKEPMWNVCSGAFLSIMGLIGFIPFRFDGWFVFATLLHVLLVIGVFLLLRSMQKLGWRLSLEGGTSCTIKNSTCILLGRRDVLQNFHWLSKRLIVQSLRIRYSE